MDKRLMGRVKSIGFAVPIVFILLLASIADFDFKLAFTIALGIDLIGLVSVLLLKQPAIEKESVQEITIGNFKETIREWMNIGWFKYILITSLVFGISLGSTIGFKNTYQERIIAISLLRHLRGFILDIEDKDDFDKELKYYSELIK